MYTEIIGEEILVFVYIIWQCSTGLRWLLMTPTPE